MASSSRGRTSSVGTYLSTTIGSDAPTVKGPLSPRKLIVCIDGTSNQYSEKNTNVIELYSHIEKSDTQLTYYNSGIGTYAKPSWRSLSYVKQMVSNGIDLAIAWNLERVIIGAYRWLSDNYRPGDQIFLFEDSPDDPVHGTFFDSPSKMREAVKQSKQKVDLFRKTFSRPSVEVHFLGAWDTVSSIGIRRGKLLPLTNRCEHIKYFRHALALDERRVKFLPEYMKLPPYSQIDESHVKEVWFAGTHSDVGGGNTRNVELNRGTEPLVWMMNEAEEAGLVVDSKNLGDGVKRARVIPSLVKGWWLLEILPLNRLSYTSKGPDRERVISQPHLGRGRKIPKNHKLHYSVLANHLQTENGKVYTPRASYNVQGTNGSGSLKLKWKEIFEDAQEPGRNQIQWEGDYKIIEVLRVVREADIKLTESARSAGINDSEWLRSVQALVADEVSAKMIWEYGGIQFLLKVAQFEDNDGLIPEIVRVVIGMTTTRPKVETPVSPASPGRFRRATNGFAVRFDTTAVPFPSVPLDDSERRRKIIEESIPRLPDLLTCYKRPSKKTIIAKGAPEASHKSLFSRGWKLFQQETTGIRNRAIKFFQSNGPASQHKPTSRTPARSRATKDSTRSVSVVVNNPATLKLVEVALDLISELADQGFVGNIAEADVLHHLVLFLTHRSFLVDELDDTRRTMILRVLDIITKLAGGDDLARTKFNQKNTIPKVITILTKSLQDEVLVAALGVLISLAIDSKNSKYFVGSQFVGALTKCLLNDTSRELVNQAVYAVTIVAEDTKVAACLTQQGILPLIMNTFIQCKTNGEQMRVIQALRILSDNDDGRSQLFQQDIISIIKPLLKTNSDAIRIIESLTHHAQARSEMVHNGMLTSVISAIDSHSADISRRAIWAAAAFAAHQDARQHIIEQRVIQKVLPLIHKSHLTGDFLELFVQLATFADTHDEFTEVQIINELMEVLKHQKVQLGRLTGSTMAPEYSGNHAKDTLIISRIIDTLAQLVVTDHFRRQMIQCKALDELLDLDPATSHIPNRGILPYLGAEDTKMTEAVLRLLKRLTGYDDSRSQIVENNRGMYLLGWLIDPQCSPPDVACSALSTILALAHHDDTLSVLITHDNVMEGVARALSGTTHHLVQDARQICRIFLEKADTKEQMENYMRSFNVSFGTTQESLVFVYQAEPDTSSLFEQVRMPRRSALNGHPMATLTGSSVSVTDSTYESAPSSLIIGH
ncbi:hypothetical protein RhiJN_24039 [Ceratobasidium sp. AG-Ba]|nr:hypothetical protein RhiJN_24039 [Ceratobasidium sp. AG-Ba]